MLRQSTLILTGQHKSYNRTTQNRQWDNTKQDNAKQTIGQHETDNRTTRNRTTQNRQQDNTKQATGQHKTQRMFWVDLLKISTLFDRLCVLTCSRKAPEAPPEGQQLKVINRWHLSRQDWQDSHKTKLQALVYDNLPPTTTLTDHATGLENRSSQKSDLNSGVQIAVRFWRSTQIMLGISCMTANVAHDDANKTKMISTRTELFSYLGRMHLMFMCVLGCYVVSTVLLVPDPFGGHWQRWWTAVRR